MCTQHAAQLAPTYGESRSPMRLAFQQKLFHPVRSESAGGAPSGRAGSNTDGRRERTYAHVQMNSRTMVMSDEKSKMADCGRDGEEGRGE